MLGQAGKFPVSHLGKKYEIQCVQVLQLHNTAVKIIETGHRIFPSLSSPGMLWCSWALASLFS